MQQTLNGFRYLALVGLTAALTLGAAHCSSTASGANGTPDASTTNDAGSPTAEASTGSGDGGARVDGGETHSDGGGSADGSPTDAASPDGGDGGRAPFALTSAAFTQGSAIPAAHACGGSPNDAHTSPPLAWTGGPETTQSYAIIMRDTSLGDGSNYHWIIYNLSAALRSLPQGIPLGAAISPPASPVTANQETASFGSHYGYFYMCPPSGTHTYEYTLYTMQTTMVPNAVNAVTYITQNNIASTQLSGTYRKP